MSRVTPLNLAEVDPETAEMVGNAERLMGFGRS